MSHEGMMRRGKEEKERGLDTADTRYFDEQQDKGNEDAELSSEELKKKEKLSLIKKIQGIFVSKKTEEQKKEEIKKLTNSKEG